MELCSHSLCFSCGQTAHYLVAGTRDRRVSTATNLAWCCTLQAWLWACWLLLASSRLAFAHVDAARHSVCQRLPVYELPPHSYARETVSQYYQPHPLSSPYPLRTCAPQLPHLRGLEPNA